MNQKLFKTLQFILVIVYFVSCQPGKKIPDTPSESSDNSEKKASSVSVSEKWKWFDEARFGMFVHFGPYAAYGRGEQVLFRENLDQREYAAQAAQWNPENLNTEEWARVAKGAGMKYVVMTARHHDGYCLWDSKVTGYTSINLAPHRDIVKEYVTAMRALGLRVGLYYSLADWRFPVYWTKSGNDPSGWADFRKYVHTQVRELMTNYGKIDVLWFDGAWPHSAEEWDGQELIQTVRELQPDILINNRLGKLAAQDGEKPVELGDFGTPEHQIISEPGRLWESCQVSTWRLWGYTIGERWRPSDLLLDYLVECASQGGNLLLNVGPQPDGRLPEEFIERMKEIGVWMNIHGEAIYGSERGDVCEFITYGWQTKKGNNLYLVVRFWDGRETLHVAGLKTRVVSASLMTTGKTLSFDQKGDHLYIQGLPKTPPTKLFPVIKITCDAPPKPAGWANDRLWHGDPERMKDWAPGELYPVILQKNN